MIPTGTTTPRKTASVSFSWLAQISRSWLNGWVISPTIGIGAPNAAHLHTLEDDPSLTTLCG